jgi:hypothetical protein
MWEECRKTGPTNRFNIARVVRLKGPLRPDQLRHSITQVMNRHEALRFTIEAPGGQPRIRVWQAPNLPWREVDLASLSDDVRKSQCEATIQGERCRPIDPTNDLPIRACLIQLGPNDHALVLTIHHLACDGISFNIVADEICLVYRMLAEGASVSLAPLSVQYGDVSEWQRDPAFEPVIEEHLKFWCDRLRRPAIPFQPLGRSVGDSGWLHSRRRKLAWPEDLVKLLRDFSRRESTTSFVVLSAATLMLLHAWTGHADLRLGTVFSGRTRFECEGMVGYFANILLLRVGADDEGSFRDLLAASQKEILQVHRHEEVPGSLVARHGTLGLSEEDIANLFAVLMIYQRTPDHGHPVGDIEILSLWEEDGYDLEDVVGGQADLVFEFVEAENQLDCLVTYKMAHYTDALISDVLKIWIDMVRGALREPDKLLSAVILQNQGRDHEDV